MDAENIVLFAESRDPNDPVAVLDDGNMIFSPRGHFEASWVKTDRERIKNARGKSKRDMGAPNPTKKHSVKVTKKQCSAWASAGRTVAKKMSGAVTPTKAKETAIKKRSAGRSRPKEALQLHNTPSVTKPEEFIFESAKTGMVFCSRVRLTSLMLLHTDKKPVDILDQVLTQGMYSANNFRVMKNTPQAKESLAS